MQLKTTKKIISIVISVAASTLLVVGVVLAVTTIGTNITADGDLTVSGNDITFGNGEAISNATDGVIKLTTDATGTYDAAKLRLYAKSGSTFYGEIKNIEYSPGATDMMVFKNKRGMFTWQSTDDSNDSNFMQRRFIDGDTYNWYLDSKPIIWSINGEPSIYLAKKNYEPALQTSTNPTFYAVKATDATKMSALNYQSLTFANGESISNATDGTIALANNAGNSITITPSGGTLISANATTAASAVKGIFIGADETSAQSGIPLLGADWSTAQGNAFYCDDDGVALTGYTECFTPRMLTTANVTSGDVSTTAIHPDLTLNANYTGTGGLSAIWGNTTIASGKTVNLSGSLGDVGGASFGLDINGTLAANSFGAGVSVGASVSGTNSGYLVGYRIRRQPGSGAGANLWSAALSIPETGGDNSDGLTQDTGSTSNCKYLKVYVGTDLYTIKMCKE